MTARRLFATRATSKRTLSNEPEIQAPCHACGSEVVQPECLPSMEQVALFAETVAIVGVQGAALANGVFCQGTPAVLVLAPSDFPDPFFWDLFGQAGSRCAEVFGPAANAASPGKDAFGIPDRKVAAALGALGLTT